MRYAKGESSWHASFAAGMAGKSAREAAGSLRPPSVTQSGSLERLNEEMCRGGRRPTRGKAPGAAGGLSIPSCRPCGIAES